MSTPVPLTVRVSTSKDSRLITRDIRNLTFRWTDPGGYATCQVSLSRPLIDQPKEIDYFGTLTVTDARNGYVVWEGRLEDPARAGGGDGEIWELSAIGGQAHTRDVVKPRIYVDTSFANFKRAGGSANPAGQDSTGEDPGGTGSDSIVMSFPQGTVIGPTGANSRVVMRNEVLRDTEQQVAMVRFSWKAGVNDGNFEVRNVQATASVGHLAANIPLTTAGSASPVQVWQPTHFPSGDYRVEFSLQRASGTGSIPNDNYWLSIFDMTYVAVRNDRHGTPITNGALYQPYVLAHEVVEDILSGLPMFDVDRANVATTATNQITQLAYIDGADAEAVLTDLMTFESGHTWRVWERDGTSGKYVFEWQPVPTSVRYEADVIDGYESNASSEGVYNKVVALWKDRIGRPRSTTVTSTVPVLDNAGLIRQAQIELSDEIGGANAALRAAQQWLADRATPSNAGRLRIARPIMDFEYSRMVQPWEIRPGLIRVRGVLPRPDAINATSRDGVTVFRIVGCEYSADDGAATLELDSYPPSMAQIVGQLRELARPGSKRYGYGSPTRRR